jgi:hypothetical protein
MLATGLAITLIPLALTRSVAAAGGWTVRWPTVAAAVVGCCALLRVGDLWNTRRGQRTHQRRPESTDPFLGPDRAIVLLALAAPLAAWIVLSLGSTITLGGVDGPRHGYFAAQMMESRYTDADHVLTDDPTAEGAAGAYYPLAVHLAVVTVAEVTGQSIANVIQGLGLLVGGVIAPIGSMLLAWRLTASVRAGVIAAVVSSLGLGWTLTAWSFGWMPYAIALSLLPGALVALSKGRCDAAAGVFGAHPAGWITMAIAAAVDATRRNQPARVKRLALLPGSLIPVGPEFIDFARGALERKRNGGTFAEGHDAVEMVSWSLGGLLQPPIGAALVVTGLTGLVLIARQGHRGLGALWLWLVGSTIAVVSLPDQLGRLLTVPWNGDMQRMVVTQYVVVAIGAGAAIDHFMKSFAARLAIRPPMMLAGAGALGIACWIQITSDHQMLASAGSRDHQLAWQWTAEQAPAGSMVVTGTPSDGGLWIETFSTVHPVIGWPPEFLVPDPSFIERENMLRYFIASDRRCTTVGCEDRARFLQSAQRSCATHVIASDTSFAPQTAISIADAERANVGRRVVQFGDVAVYELPAQPCSAR